MDREDERSEHGSTDRRRFLKCMAWAGAGTLWTMHAGVLQARMLGTQAQDGAGVAGDALKDATFSFVQVSDSHIGFTKAPNPDVTGTFKAALARIDAQPLQPDFIIHTGDLTHLSRPDEFDTVQQLMRGSRTQRAFFVPGEHDVIGDNGREFFHRFGEGQTEGGWYSFDHRGVHFVALVNVLSLKGGGLGWLGPDQLAWLKQDLAARSSETPIVVFAHMPLWSLYPAWGWGTDDAGQAMTMLRRFGSVTVLNGHIHQIQQKVEGQITFHTARSTAYPQPAPGVGSGPGPLKEVAPGQLASYLGVREVRHVQAGNTLALTEEALS
ncbi:metallophosphoesterase [Trinickia sp. Y13]|uniref:metallophosphoesterase family protein n=1 Tax=Trinickia sp. Y13 TaxID=2917807 RepID=UPI0024062EAF|nr:metallophosphoesterase [Trinickia sp. Y13]MDG0026294.1 metallophosphoesterase [Trinickia sp. Y13]